MAKGVLFVVFDYSGAHADEFHDWYDLEHVPERLRVPGFINAERWISDDNPKIAVASYDLDSPRVLYTPPYEAVGGANVSVWTRRVTGMCQRIMRYEGEQVLPGDVAAPPGARALLAASMNVDPAAEHEFNEWYNTEHLPQLAAVPGVLCARRFRAADTASERKYVALYHLTGPEVSRSAAWTNAADTEWTRRMRPYFSDLLVLRCTSAIKNLSRLAGEVKTRQR
jgi:hypothetical protein